MRPFSELTQKAKVIEVLRWLCVLPAAMLGAMAARLLIGAVIHMARDGGGSALLGSNAFYWIGTSLFHAVFELAFVLAGASMAPRRRIGTAVALAIAAMVLSLLTHILVQHFAGNRVGLTNYVHFGSETIGAVAGALLGAILGRRNLDLATKSGDSTS